MEADGRLAFVNDTAYDVITRGEPNRVDMQLKLVQPPPDLAEQVEGDHRTWVETPPWVIRANRIPNEQEHFLRIEFYQSSVEDCARPGSQSVEVEGKRDCRDTHPAAAAGRALGHGLRGGVCGVGRRRAYS